MKTLANTTPTDPQVPSDPSPVIIRPYNPPFFPQPPDRPFPVTCPSCTMSRSQALKSIIKEKNNSKMLTDAQKEVQTQTQTNAIAPFLIGVDLSSVLTAITDLKEFFMSKFLITTKQLELLTASIDAVKNAVDSESIEIKANLQIVIDALKVPDVDISAQVEALEAIKEQTDALSNAITVDVPVVESPVDVPVDTMPVEPDPEAPVETPVL